MKIEEEYKACITELEAKELVTPLEQREARIIELKDFSATIVLRLKDI